MDMGCVAESVGREGKRGGLPCGTRVSRDNAWTTSFLSFNEAAVRATERELAGILVVSWFLGSQSSLLGAAVNSG